MSKFTLYNTAMLLIDHQTGTINWSPSSPKENIIQNTRALARTAIATDMPLILTSSQEDKAQGPLIKDLEQIAPEAFEARIKRGGIVNCWDWPEYKNAVLETGKKKIIMAGLTNDVCIVFAAISAIKEGYEVQVVVDAGGSPTKLADETSLRRMENNGVILTSTNQVMAELAEDWSTPNGSKIITIMFEEILSKL
ncbi:MAG: isochorismatase family protein [Rhizobacter sp.]|nr:isochorismatase family protein [Ferruginibacter sp.]